jgi:hypothetical protein
MNGQVFGFQRDKVDKNTSKIIEQALSLDLGVCKGHIAEVPAFGVDRPLNTSTAFSSLDDFRSLYHL